jgi:hypothetical protein
MHERIANAAFYADYTRMRVALDAPDTDNRRKRICHFGVAGVAAQADTPISPSNELPPDGD